MRIIFHSFPYNDAIDKAGLHNLYNRRESLSCKLFNVIVSDEDHELAELCYHLRQALPRDYEKREPLKFPVYIVQYVQIALKTHSSCITRRNIVTS